jgi:hypothetical protein
VLAPRPPHRPRRPLLRRFVAGPGDVGSIAARLRTRTRQIARFGTTARWRWTRRDCRLLHGVPGRLPIRPQRHPTRTVRRPDAMRCGNGFARRRRVWAGTIRRILFLRGTPACRARARAERAVWRALCANGPRLPYRTSTRRH